MLLGDFPRGMSPRRLYRRRTPLAAWADPAYIAGRNALRYDPDKPGGKILLGAVNGSLLAIDPKAELASFTARRRAEGLGHQVNVLDLFGWTALWVELYNAS